MLKFGVRLLGNLGTTSLYQKICAEAERSGFDACWFAHDPFLPSSWVRSVAVASATHSIKVGFNVKPFTVDPSEIATFAATLDEYSGGRVIMAIGSHTQTMYEWIGLGDRDVIELTRETVHLVRGLLAGDGMPYQGRLFKWDANAYLRFTPLRRRIPIYVPCFGGEYCRLSGIIGDGSLPMATPPDAFDIPVHYIDEGIKLSGRSKEEVDRVALIWMYYSPENDVDKQALKRTISYFVPYLDREMLLRIGIDKEDIMPIAEKLAQKDYEGAADAVTDEMLDLAVYGNADRCIEKIEMLRKKGATSVSIGGPLGKDPIEAVRLIGRDIIPHFKEQN
jgi:5,10-methylenetetrahydromethanopterin reductase